MSISYIIRYQNMLTYMYNLIAHLPQSFIIDVNVNSTTWRSFKINNNSINSILVWRSFIKPVIFQFENFNLSFFFLVGHKSCTHPISGSSDTAPYVPKSDRFEYRVATWGNALRQTIVRSASISPNAGVFILSFNFLCLSLPTFSRRSREPDHSMVSECGAFIASHYAHSLFRPLSFILHLIIVETNADT